MSIMPSSVRLPKGISHQAVSDYYFDHELTAGNDEAVRLTAERFGISCAEVEAVLVELDALDNGNL